MSSIYSPLRSDKAEIRLLKLEPASSIDDIVVCSLQVSSLGNQPDFEALSYCWGDPTVTKMCQLNGVEWPLTVNLESGLRHLRHPTEPIILWVDAVCINQQDVQERNSQVALMKNIYSSAGTVRVWMGEAADGSDEVMQTIHKLASIDPSTDDISARLRDIRLEGKRLINDDLTTKRPCISSLYAFARRPWWSRVWVLQEVILARSTIVHCGYQQISMKDLFKIRHLDRGLVLTNVRLFKAVSQSIAPLVNAIARSEELQLLLTTPTSLYPNACSLTLAILLNGWRQQATDPRDKIYGMLGIVPDIMNHFRVDYNLSLQEVYIKHALHLMNTSRSLLIFDIAAAGTRNLQPQLPSWVPDWSTTIREAHLSFQHGISHHYRACGDLDFFIQVVSNTTIQLRGTMLDVVTEIGNVFGLRQHETGNVGFFHREEHQQYSTYLQWLGMCGFGSPDEFNISESARTTAGPAFQVISKCLTVDERTGSPVFRTTKNMLDDDVFLRWWHWLGKTTNQSFEPPDAHVSLLQRAISIGNKNNRFIVTTQGFVGTASHTVLPKDIVYVLGGGKQAYVLRPVDDAPQQPTFTLVGPCYLHGYMMGEAMAGEGWVSKCHDVYLQ